MKTKSKEIFLNGLKLWLFISYKKKNQLKIYALLTILSGFAEMLSVGSIIPFVMALINPTQLNDFIFFQNIFKLFNLQSIAEVKFFLCLLFSIAVIFAGLIKITLSWFQSTISYEVAAELGNKIYSNVLNRDYEYHLNINSSDVISTIANKANIVADNIIQPMLSFVLAFTTIIALSAFLLLINPIVTLIIFLITFFFYILISVLVKNQIAKLSKDISKNFDSVMKIIREGLDGIRYIILTSSQNTFVKLHEKFEVVLRQSQAFVNFASIFPRAVIETLSLLILAWVVFIFFSSFENSFNLIYFLSAMVMGFQKMLPIIQRAYLGWIRLSGSNHIILDTLHQLNYSNNSNSKKNKNNYFDKIEYKNKINIKNLSYYYKKNPSKKILNDINITITKSSKIGITGVSGSGKSTLLDIIMGFLEPQSGEIFVDNIKLDFNENVSKWQANISLIPQKIYLSDSSIISNIAFGVEESQIDVNRVIEVLKLSQLDKFVNTLPDKYEFRVGEDGKNLSFGQRQRIAIARALYRDSDLLVIDEGTSALDQQTQSKIIKSLNDLKSKPTIIMVAHRIEILEDFDAVYELKNNRLKIIFTK